MFVGFPVTGAAKILPPPASGSYCLTPGRAGLRDMWQRALLSEVCPLPPRGSWFLCQWVGTSLLSGPHWCL